MKTVAAVFPALPQAGQACRDLEHLGIPREDISLIAGNDWGKHDEYLEKVRHASTPTGTAAASGAVIGGGLEIAAATHVRVADKTTFYQLPEGRRGFYVGGGASVSVSRIIAFIIAT